MKAPEGIAAVLLAGGLGTRIRSLHPDVPKPMIPIAGQPFLEWVIQYFEGQGVGRFVVALGHLAEVAERYVATRAGASVITTTREKELLGTGGATLFAFDTVVGCQAAVVANADSLVMADLDGIWAALAAGADGAIVGVDVPDASRFGSMELGPANRLVRFVEKRPGTGCINAGIYAFTADCLRGFPRRQVLSLEKDLIPSLLERGARLDVVKTARPFLDIGTPESCAQAATFVEAHARRR